MTSLPSPHITPRSIAALIPGKDRQYKSPQRKLVRFFARSRDQWKAKCLDAKALAKGLNHRMRFLARSKDHWKRRVRALEGELTQLKAQAQAMREEIAALKKR